MPSINLELDEDSFHAETFSLTSNRHDRLRVRWLPAQRNGLWRRFLLAALVATVSTSLLLLLFQSRTHHAVSALVQSKDKISLCIQLLQDSATSVPQSVKQVLKSHCELNPSLPLERMIPNMTLFERVHSLISRYKQEYNSTISLLAGRGSTATRCTATWIRQTRKYGVLHYNHALCPTNPDKRVEECMRKHALKYTRSIHPVLRDRLFNNRDISESEYASLLLDPFLESLEKILSCGHCGHLIFSDTPWPPNLFAEFYLAGGPETKVILNRREGKAWARSRQQHKELFGCIPRKEAKDGVLDPFSYTQCNGNGVVQDIRMMDELDVVPMLNQYEAYVHQYVQDDFLLDINLFTSKFLHAQTDDGNATEAWTKMNRALVEAFLFDGTRT